MKFITAFTKTLKLLKQDKWLIVLSLIPTIIGISIFSVIGKWIYTDLKLQLESYLISIFGIECGFLSYIVAGFLTLLLFFLINWTFVLLISIISFPFNDAIASRVHRQLVNKQNNDELGFWESVKRMGPLFINELKKILFIVSLTVLALVLNFIPFLIPISLAMAALLVSIGFLDYDWSYRELSFKDCRKDLFGQWWTYMLGGFVFMGLLSLPIVNVFALPLGVIYFTILTVDGEQFKIDLSESSQEIL